MWENVGNFDDCSSTASFDMASWGGSSGSGAERGGHVYAVISTSNRVDHTTDAQIDSDKFTNIQNIIAGNTPSSLDLVAMYVAGPSSRASGAALDNLNFAVHNYSTASASGSWSYEVYLSTNAFISQTDIYLGSGSFQANFLQKSTVEVTVGQPPAIPANVPAGEYFLGIYLTFNDANAANNGSHGQDAQAITITCPGVPAPTLQAPVPDATCMPLNLTLDWSDVGSSPDYELQVGLSCG